MSKSITNANTGYGSAKVKALSVYQKISIFLTVIIVIGLWYLNYHYLHKDLGKDNVDDRGTFGDMFGAVNALFSGLAFAGIIWTILLQRNELRLQREDSRLNREEAIDQNKTLKQQRFENTFFNMLSLQNEIVKNLSDPRFSGRQVIEEATKDLFCFLAIENYNKQNGLKTLQPQPNVLRDTPLTFSNARSMLDLHYHDYFYDRYAGTFNHFFRHLYHIFKFIYFSDLTIGEKNFYATLTRAQLSQGELYLIAFNMLMPNYGKPNLLYLVKEYDILQNMDWTKVTPLAFKDLIKDELQKSTYSFSQEKPATRNIK